jgi:hypothetical protein
MGEVHEGICSKHQLVLKMKWLLHQLVSIGPIRLPIVFVTTRVTMSANGFDSIQLVLVVLMHPVIKSYLLRG